MPVLSNTTVSILGSVSSARPCFTRMPERMQADREVTTASGAAMRMPVPRSELMTASAALDPISPPASAATPSAGTTIESASASPRDWSSSLCATVSRRMSAILPAVVSRPARSTRTRIWPATSRVAASTGSSAPRSTGAASPVRACWSSMPSPDWTVPSTGTASPVLTTITSPARISSTGTSAVEPSGRSRRTMLGWRPKASTRSRADCAWVLRSSVRPTLRKKAVIAPAKISPVNRQVVKMMLSSTSTASRRSRTRTRAAWR